MTSGQESTVTETTLARQWWSTPLVPALRWQGQIDLFEFKASSRIAKDNTEKACLKTPKQTTTPKKTQGQQYALEFPTLSWLD